jgi:bifunctional DNA-binding transcriptional regulator/antitoxin component of YhaV-PrlF toxin-antitoxin module
MTQLELIDVEGELGVVLPDEVLSRLGVRPGGELVLAETPFGYLLTTPKLAPEGNDPLGP